VIASLVETCKLAGVEPRAYLADVITRIVERHPNSRLEELLPCPVLDFRQIKRCPLRCDSIF